MSCHVMSCRHCCINSKKSFSKTFSFHKIIYKYFAGFLACIKSSLRGLKKVRSNPQKRNFIILDCHASLHQRWADARSARNDEKNIVITRFCKNRSNPKCVLCFFDNNVASAHCVNNSNRSTQGVRHRRPVGKTSCYKKLDCFASRCVPHYVCFSNGNARNDNDKNFQFDKFQRLLSVIYKKLINYKGDFKMRNQTNNVFKVKRQKSKLFLIILCIFGLLFSYSCSCKNRVSNPDDTPTTPPPPPGTFSISEATDNVKASIVKTSETIGTIKIGFVSANNYAYTMDYTVEDSEADESKKITKADFTKSDGNVLTFNDTGLTKVRNSWEASTDSKENTITINFTFTADDKTLNNNTQNLSVEVKLTKAPKIDASNIGTILNRIHNSNGIAWGDLDNSVRFEQGKYENNAYTLTSKVSGTYDNPIKVSEVKAKFMDKQNGNYYNGNNVNPYFTVEDDGTVATKSTTEEKVSFSVNLKFTDLAESDMTTLSVELVKATGETWTWDDTAS